MTYAVERVRLDGPLGSEDDVLVARMPRARFLSIVEDVVQITLLETEMIPELMAVARTIERFPLATWIDKERGCGCVVGEFAVAMGADRRELVQRGVEMEISTCLRIAGYDACGVEQVIRFGLELDETMMTEVDVTHGAHIAAVLIEDDERTEGTGT